jgi:hypothetical protein
MDVHTYPAELPERQEFLANFRGPEGAVALKAVLEGSVPIA